MHIFDRFHIRQLIQAHFLAVLPDWQERPELNSQQALSSSPGSSRRSSYPFPILVYKTGVGNVDFGLAWLGLAWRLEP